MLGGGGVAVGVNATVRVTVPVRVPVTVGVRVAVDDPVRVRVTVAVPLDVGVEVRVRVTVLTGVGGAGVRVAVFAAVRVAVEVAVRVLVALGGRVWVMVLVAVIVAVGGSASDGSTRMTTSLRGPRLPRTSRNCTATMVSPIPNLVTSGTGKQNCRVVPVLRKAKLPKRSRVQAFDDEVCISKRQAMSCRPVVTSEPAAKSSVGKALAPPSGKVRQSIPGLPLPRLWFTCTCIPGRPVKFEIGMIALPSKVPSLLAVRPDVPLPASAT